MIPARGRSSEAVVRPTRSLLAKIPFDEGIQQLRDRIQAVLDLPRP